MMKLLARSFFRRQDIENANGELELKRRRFAESGEKEISPLLFKPPLWRQRRELVMQILNQKKPNSVLDLGCGEGALTSFLVPTSDFPLVRIVGVEPNIAHIKVAEQRCQPVQMDYQYLRENPLRVEFYQDSLEVVNEDLIGIDAIVCLEVIEHLYPAALTQFPMVTLGTYRPQTMIVSTPNAEFNVNFPNLKYGTAESVFRNNDHKFEWTRSEFSEWCESIAQQYGYDVTLTGVGTLNNDSSNGFCTQVAVFTTARSFVPTRLVGHRARQPFAISEFPYYQGGVGSDEEILQEACNELQFGPQISASPPHQLDIETFWRSLRIRQLCKTKSRLCEVFMRSGYFEMAGEDKVLMFKNPWLCHSEPIVEPGYADDHSQPQDTPNYGESVNWKLEYTADGEAWPRDEIPGSESWIGTWN
ncbi:hypothetical protein K493DRAFT_339025 [Basidiobolus meristosporus CBS 931.73]|uniref:Small RNA 2'-O-methyltransferase n=1 Tax=Basidiobolus meristosporus CBS 931.73 TaxID=1314790 RepID=A0A1Y1Y341_9FUNG|nr:hypothetical protein K493DRAFT_339025 [Basidiobolus meristosporus CBS 931.73]|eukprot:ORX92014.1 hypothetical protein K493DRAFT_339025 [Basidiobolus meristosporus CBS 931.73]